MAQHQLAADPRWLDIMSRSSLKDPGEQQPPSAAAMLRFYQIAYEAIRLRRKDIDVLDDLLVLLATVGNEHADRLLRNEAGLIGWIWREEENKLVIKFENSVYVGDADSRV